jgi:putative FmdB family regulatory protein
MPIYEYQCESCGFKLEKLRRMNDEPFVDCPECGKPSLRRLVSAAAFRLKGAGWYETDFKKDNKKNLHDSGSSSDEKAANKPSDKSSGKPGDAKKAETKKTETKPAAKPAAD